jgi:hypothetical protein
MAAHHLQRRHGVYRRPSRRREHNAKPNAPIMSAWLNPVPPPHAAVQVPVVVAASPKPSFRSRTHERASIARYRVEVVSADILAPLPHVARHVEESKLIRRLLSHGMRARAMWKQFAKPVGQAPSDPPAQQVHQSLIPAPPTRSIPRNVICLIASDERENRPAKMDRREPRTPIRPLTAGESARQDHPPRQLEGYRWR